jgi:hypothetical protein
MYDELYIDIVLIFARIYHIMNIKFIKLLNYLSIYSYYFIVP